MEGANARGHDGRHRTHGTSRGDRVVTLSELTRREVRELLEASALAIASTQSPAPARTALSPRPSPEAFP